ncbi:flagellar basal body rod protein FlgB [Fredinandcohnia quinoae]|uniref:Flagellar basal body rod protein FlgB n=1 Tax=Fredinandcohnia quinoae TaxID=2918902 RepID=A0AAW5DSZ2_9BACI|nr:flagellar basal body rod protein FlgB [Fredinandcohnia sp. SECRCQ15]MCH1623790.1 flagellar basal body rod protein FlgB [Fredinandcohnia sp. SECRCQ15]
MKLFSNTIKSLENALDYSSLRQKVISNNIANVDTPNYKAKDVSFKDHLTKEVGQQMSAYRTSEKHLEFSRGSSSNYQITTKNDTSYNHNGNNVDVDKEMAILAENQIYYNAVTDRISGKFNSLKSVIRGGK